MLISSPKYIDLGSAALAFSEVSRKNNEIVINTTNAAKSNNFK